ncbi:hypothetical protein O181_056649 [Austropuccinia psidii MF-1]|uniref:Uncharacterized protein n=1 Tax=Austropuccinia psidii MF-1 TaxID=1389203 RepID=A0A9Q3E8Z5_9BASI|nr:hypothetical protein [Austropuccinia psidii MF-1]
MDLPYLSFHSSLEEEPEEIETVLKVVPPYHQYSDVFSKVKEEGHPPHCSCDCHIELEGSLPPFGVIYSLSNNDSETLWAYISENLEKCFINPTSHQQEHLSFASRKRMVAFFCVLTTSNTMLSLGRTGILFPQ